MGPAPSKTDVEHARLQRQGDEKFQATRQLLAIVWLSQWPSSERYRSVPSSRPPTTTGLACVEFSKCSRQAYLLETPSTLFGLRNGYRFGDLVLLLPLTNSTRYMYSYAVTCKCKRIYMYTTCIYISSSVVVQSSATFATWHLRSYRFINIP